MINLDWQAEENAPAPGSPLCSLDELGEGELREFTFGENPSFRLIVYRKAGEVSGYVNQCPHHWLPMNGPGGEFLFYKEDLLMCRHHSAVFDLAAGGQCAMGPCQGSRLTKVPLQVTAGMVNIGDAP